MKWNALLLTVLLAMGASLGCDKTGDDASSDESSEAQKQVEAPETPEGDKDDEPADEDQEGGFSVTSEAWESGGDIPAKYTCDGDKVSPPLAWTNLPEGTVSVAIIATDPDAPEGTFKHWGVYGIPADQTVLQEGVSDSEELDSGANQAQNDFGKTGYGAICPPKGQTHTYQFTVLALDTFPSFTDTPKVQDLRESIMTNVVARDTLEGTYTR